MPSIFSFLAKLSLNFESSAAGGVKVELQDDAGKVLADCAEMIGDEIAVVLKQGMSKSVVKLTNCNLVH